MQWKPDPKRAPLASQNQSKIKTFSDKPWVRTNPSEGPSKENNFWTEALPKATKIAHKYLIANFSKATRT
jgi:hypothetical protein